MTPDAGGASGKKTIKSEEKVPNTTAETGTTDRSVHVKGHS